MTQEDKRVFQGRVQHDSSDPACKHSDRVLFEHTEVY